MLSAIFLLLKYKYLRFHLKMVYSTTNISGNNVRKSLLESDFLESCSGIYTLFNV